MCFFKAKTSFDFACFCCLLCLKSPVMVSLTPMPSGGGCRPQGRPERENVTEPRCGNDRNRGSMRTILPFASGHVLPLPSSASRGIGGCHLPPLGEGKGGCEFAVGGIKPLPDAAGDVGDAIPYGRVRIRPSLVRVAAGSILRQTLPCRGRRSDAPRSSNPVFS